MKLIQKLLLPFVAFTAFCAPLCAMQKSSDKSNVGENTKINLATTLTSEEEWGSAEYHQSVLLKHMGLVAANKNGKMRFNFNILTNDTIVEGIIKLHKSLKQANGKDSVFVLIDAHSIHLSSPKAIKKLVEAGVSVRIGVGVDNHWKAFLAEYEDELGEKRTLYIGGSSNASNNALGSIEIDSRFYDFHEMYQEVIEYFDQLFSAGETYEEYVEYKEGMNANILPKTPIKKLTQPVQALEITPEKPKFLSSQTTDIWGSVIERFKKAEKGDNVFLGSYTFGHQKLTDALCKYAKDGVNISLYIDKNSIKGTSARSQIEALIKAGVNVFVYVTTNRHIMHAKFAIFDRVNRSDKKEEKKIVMSMSQNALERDPIHERVEGMVIVPNDPSLLKEYSDLLGRFDIVSIENFKEMTAKELNKKLPRPMVQLTSKQDIDDIVKHLSDLMPNPKAVIVKNQSKNKRKSQETQAVARQAKKQKKQ